MVRRPSLCLVLLRLVIPIYEMGEMKGRFGVVSSVYRDQPLCMLVGTDKRKSSKYQFAYVKPARKYMNTKQKGSHPTKNLYCNKQRR